jgi:hypothetical protein
MFRSQQAMILLNEGRPLSSPHFSAGIVEAEDSMSFLESVQHGIEKASQEASRLAKVQHLRNVEGDLNNKSSVESQALVAKAMELFQGGHLTQSELQPLCQQIATYHQQIAEVQAEIQKLQAEAQQQAAQAPAPAPVTAPPPGYPPYPGVPMPPPGYPAYGASTPPPGYPPYPGAPTPPPGYPPYPYAYPGYPAAPVSPAPAAPAAPTPTDTAAPTPATEAAPASGTGS